MKEYILDTCIILELLHGTLETKKWLEDNKESAMYISGWTVIELLQEKRSKQEMENCLKKLVSQWKILWNRPEFSDILPEILIRDFHTQRDDKGKLKGNAIFDALIYVTSKSNNSIPIVTRDGHFDFANDIEVINLQKEELYKT